MLEWLAAETPNDEIHHHAGEDTPADVESHHLPRPCSQCGVVGEVVDSVNHEPKYRRGKEDLTPFLAASGFYEEDDSQGHERVNHPGRRKIHGERRPRIVRLSEMLQFLEKKAANDGEPPDVQNRKGTAADENLKSWAHSS